MAATPSVKVIKTILFRGATRQWSNRYHFNGGTPADVAHWNTLFDAITTAEKAIFPSTISIVSAVGYAAGSDVPVATKTYSLAGTLGALSTTRSAPEVAGLLRYATTARTAKNHPVYLFNYFHGVYPSSSDITKLDATQSAAIASYASSWISGFSDGTTSYVRAGPKGATATGSLVEVYLTHRNFPH